MDRFLASSVNRVDAKGRVSIPAHFRAVIQKRGYGDLYALRELLVPAMKVGGLDLLDGYEVEIAQAGRFLQSTDDISYHCHGDGTFLKIDQDGRIMMTEFIRAHTGIGSEVVFVGMGQTFQMWEPGRFGTHQEEVRERLRQRFTTAGRQAHPGGTE